MKIQEIDTRVDTYANDIVSLVKKSYDRDLGIKRDDLNRDIVQQDNRRYFGVIDSHDKIVAVTGLLWDKQFDNVAVLMNGAIDDEWKGQNLLYLIVEYMVDTTDFDKYSGNALTNMLTSSIDLIRMGFSFEGLKKDHYHWNIPTTAIEWSLLKQDKSKPYYHLGKQKVGEGKRELEYHIDKNNVYIDKMENVGYKDLNRLYEKLKGMGYNKIYRFEPNSNRVNQVELLKSAYIPEGNLLNHIEKSDGNLDDVIIYANYFNNVPYSKNTIRLY